MQRANTAGCSGGFQNCLNPFLFAFFGFCSFHAAQCLRMHEQTEGIVHRSPTKQNQWEARVVCCAISWYSLLNSFLFLGSCRLSICLIIEPFPSARRFFIHDWSTCVSKGTDRYHLNSFFLKKKTVYQSQLVGQTTITGYVFRHQNGCSPPCQRLRPVGNHLLPHASKHARLLLLWYNIYPQA